MRENERKQGNVTMKGSFHALTCRVQEQALSYLNKKQKTNTSYIFKICLTMKRDNNTGLLKDSYCIIHAIIHTKIRREKSISLFQNIPSFKKFSFLAASENLKRS